MGCIVWLEVAGVGEHQREPRPLGTGAARHKGSPRDCGGGDGSALLPASGDFTLKIRQGAMFLMGNQ